MYYDQKDAYGYHPLAPGLSGWWYSIWSIDFEHWDPAGSQYKGLPLISNLVRSCISVVFRCLGDEFLSFLVHT